MGHVEIGQFRKLIAGLQASCRVSHQESPSGLFSAAVELRQCCLSAATDRLYPATQLPSAINCLWWG